jgi:hypothetical protein
VKVIAAKVPLSEMFGAVSETCGRRHPARAVYSMSFDSYSEVPRAQPTSSEEQKTNRFGCLSSKISLSKRDGDARVRPWRTNWRRQSSRGLSHTHPTSVPSVTSDHGKTTLTAAITKVLRQVPTLNASTRSTRSTAPEGRSSAESRSTSPTWVPDREAPPCAHVDAPATPLHQNMITGAAPRPG